MFFINQKLIAIVVFVFLSFTSFAQRSNCSVAPYSNTLMQPDGSEITLTPLGNEAIHYLETNDGYTVLKNTEGYFEYATLDENKNLKLSGVIARNTDRGKTMPFQAHLRYSNAQQQILLEAHAQLNETRNELNKATNPNPFPPKGIRKVPVILVEYPDLRATIAPEQFELLFNQINYNETGSFRDFYLATSNNQLDLTCSVYGWVMADSNYKYYGKGSSPNYSTATRSLLLKALQKANDTFNIDFKQYDNDNDGFVDGVIILHAGIGAEEQSAPNANDYIWSFRSTLQIAQRPTYDGVKIAAFAMFPEKRYSSGAYTMVGIGVMSHEFGHLLDLPDLYSTQYINEGAGNYSLMAGGPWLNKERTPCYNDAWSRIRMGWVTPTDITDTATYQLNYCVVDSDMVYRIKTARSNEYFLLENRQRKGFDSYLPSKGLAIWHINTNMARLLSESGNNNVNNDTSQLGVGLLQADGLRNLEMNQNRGDATDLFPQNNKNNCTPFTKPNTSLHYKTNGIRVSSGVFITNIKQNADSSIVFEYGRNKSAAFAANRSSGCAPLNVNFTSNTVGADSFVWDFANGNISYNENPPQQVFTKTGTYIVTLKTFYEGVFSDSGFQVITVLETPEISFGYERDSLYNIKLVNFTKYGNTYNWVITGKDTLIHSSDTTPQFGISGPQKMLVQLTVVSKDGCSKFKQDSIEIFAVGLPSIVDYQKIAVTAYPNPTHNELNLVFNLPQAAHTTVDIFNVLGVKVKSMPGITLNKGEQKLSVSLESLTPGLYIVELNSGIGKAQIKVRKE